VYDDIVYFLFVKREISQWGFFQPEVFPLSAVLRSRVWARPLSSSLEDLVGIELAERMYHSL
jgi:hypothetical protein